MSYLGAMSLFWVLVTISLLVFVFYWSWPKPLARAAQWWERHRGHLRRHNQTHDGVNWHFLEGGCGEPLVLLHGFNGDAYHFARTARYLTKHFRLIIPDLPGFGETRSHAIISHRIEDVAKRLLDWLDQRHIDTFYVGGNSMGGYIATAMGQMAPERIRGLWLLAPGGIRSAPLSPVLQEVAEDRHNPLVVRNYGDFKRLLDYCFVHQPWMPLPLLRYLANKAADTCEQSLGIFDAMLNDSSALEVMAEALEIPALIVWGDQDRVLHPDGAGILADLMPYRELIMMPNIGHLPMIESPKPCAEAWLAFTEQWSRQAINGATGSSQKNAGA